jgi:uncharacterized membrane protein
MDAAHIHLMVNHVPVLLTFFSLLLLAWGWLRSNESFISLSLVGYVLAGIFAFIAYQSGEGAEDVVEGLAGVTHDIIEAHEEAGEWTMYLAVIQGIIGLIGLGLYKAKSKTTHYLIPLLWVFSLYVAGNFFYTAYTGGQIRHTEIRPEQTTQVDTPSSSVDDEDED